MHHVDLFSGIGGFAYAIDKVYGKQEHTFVENDPFCQAVLRKHWPDSEIHGDIRKFVADAEQSRLEGGSEKGKRHTRQRSRNGANQAQETFILTGGFPCQPFSQAGVREGTNDERYLWPAMLDAIRQFRPRWVVAENVVGLLSIQGGLVFEQVCADLENEGYEVQPYCIPACTVGAPHKRERVWIVANCTSQRCCERKQEDNRPSKTKTSDRLTAQNEAESWERSWQEVAAATCYDGVDDEFSTWLDSLGLDVFDTMMGYGTPAYKRRVKELPDLQKAIQTEEIQRKVGGLLTLEETPVLLEVLRQYIRRLQESKELSKTVASDKHTERSLQSVWLEEIRRASDRYPSYRWGCHEQLVKELRNTLPFVSHETSHAVAEEGYRLWLLYKAIHPSKEPVELNGSTISAARHRKERLKACGNAIVPQVAMQIFEGIKAVD